VELCPPEFAAYFPGPPPMDLAGFDQFESMIRSALSNIRHRIEEIVGEGDGVAVRLTFGGMQQIGGLPTSAQAG
jgi:predicted ester cyclase